MKHEVYIATHKAYDFPCIEPYIPIHVGKENSFYKQLEDIRMYDNYNIMQDTRLWNDYRIIRKYIS